MNENFWQLISDGANWLGSQGIILRTLEHLEYSAFAVLIAAVIAVPIGLMIGHTGRGETFVVGFANTVRALPSLGLMTLLVLLIGIGLAPPIISLTVLAIPPLLAGVYSGIANVDRSTVDAGRAMGMTESQILFRIEVPNAMPLILGGVRGASLQVIATATIAAFVNLGGLGRYIFDGLALYNYGQVLLGAVLVTVLALLVDAVLAGVVRRSRPGSARRFGAATHFKTVTDYEHASSRRNPSNRS